MRLSVDSLLGSLTVLHHEGQRRTEQLLGRQSAAEQAPPPLWTPRLTQHWDWTGWQQTCDRSITQFLNPNENSKQELKNVEVKRNLFKGLFNLDNVGDFQGLFYCRLHPPLLLPLLLSCEASLHPCTSYLLSQPSMLINKQTESWLHYFASKQCDTHSCLVSYRRCFWRSERPSSPSLSLWMKHFCDTSLLRLS